MRAFIFPLCVTMTWTAYVFSSAQIETGPLLLTPNAIQVLSVPIWMMTKRWWNCIRSRGGVQKRRAGIEETAIRIIENPSMITIGIWACIAFLRKGNLLGRLTTLEQIPFWPLTVIKIHWKVSGQSCCIYDSVTCLAYHVDFCCSLFLNMFSQLCQVFTTKRSLSVRKWRRDYAIQMIIRHSWNAFIYIAQK